MVTERSGRVTRQRGALVIPLVAVAALFLAVIGTYRIGQLNRYICDGPCGAKYVEPPEELGLVVQRPIVPDLVRASALDKAKVESAVSSQLRQSALGSQVGFVALDPKTGATLTSRGSGSMTPASTTKVLTAFAALTAIDSQTRFATRVVSDKAGSIVLVGGGDPYLDIRKPKTALYAHSANLTELASRTARALRKAGTKSVSLGFDDSLFSGPDVSSRWPASYVTGNIVTPVSALWAAQGVGANGVRSRNPAQSAAAEFSGLLSKDGITVRAGTSRTKATQAASKVAWVESATVAQILESTIQHSDNEAAEVMLRHVAVAKGKPGTFDAGVSAVDEILDAAGIDTGGLRLFDGSGLSRDNLISPLTLAQTVRAATVEGPVDSFVSDLPVGGFSGSIYQRFNGNAIAGRGVVRAKTGTLTGVNSLTGIVNDADGRAIVFAVMADKTKAIPPLEAKAALDNVVAALARCHCGE
ncbi:MAG: D-alanyl-D-alanine carboxypeptidase/D-alanyl-D-alanine-endopeptidase [Aeromicrobium sp.]